MTEVENHIGQVLLVLRENAILNHAGQTLATVDGGRLLNSRGQELAQATEDGFELGGGASFRLDGEDLIGPNGSRLGRVRGGSVLERNLAAAAYVTFCLDS